MIVSQRPYTYTPSGNPIVYVLSASEYTASDFRFLAHITIGGEETKLRKSPTQGQYQYFDFQNVVENYLEPSFNIGYPGVYYQANALKEYEIQFGFYSGSTEYLQLTETGITFNSYFDRNDFTLYDQEDYLMTPETPYTGTSSTIGKFLTDYTEKKVSLLDKGRIGVLGITDNSPEYIHYACYNDSDSLIGLYRIENDYISDNKILDFPSHPIDINESAADGQVQKGFITWSNYTDEVITSAVSYYKIYCVYTNFDNVQVVSNILTYRLVDKCSRFEGINVGWLNKYGSFDYYYFNMIFTRSNEIERKEYTQKLGSLSGSKWSYTQQDFETKNYHNIISENYILNTDYIDDNDSMMIQDLINSPLVYAEIDGVWIGVIPTIESFKQMNYKNRDMNQYSIGLKLNYKNKTQRL